MGKKRTLGPYDYWEYGHDVLALVVKIRECLEAIHGLEETADDVFFDESEKDFWGQSYSDHQKRLSESILALDKLLNEEIVLNFEMYNDIPF